MDFFFVVGEDSGDALAAPLIRALKEKHGEDTKCYGIGGPLMKAEGFEELLPMDQICVIGIWEVIPKIPHLIKINKSIVSEIEQRRPDAVITVDFPDFNFILAKSLKTRRKYKGSIIHYVAPSVWAWRPGRAKKIAEYLDGIMCLFPMEVELFTKHGLPAKHVGHPLSMNDLSEVKPNNFREYNKISPESKTIGLFFGSRDMEIKNLSKILKNAVSIIGDVDPSICVIAPTLPVLEYQIEKVLEDFEIPHYVSSNPDSKWEAFKACDIAIAVSGTVALELAYAGVPHIMAYKISPITAIIIRTLATTKFAHLANILIGKEVVPECLQGKCNPDYIAQQANDLLQSKEKQNVQKEEFKAIAKLLGGGDATSPSMKAANFVTSLVDGDELNMKEENVSSDHSDVAVSVEINLTSIFNNA